MLVSKTPYRVSLFGGGTDFPEYFNKSPSIVIGGAINKFVYVTINTQFSKITKNNIKIFYKNVELVDSVKSLITEIASLNDIQNTIKKKQITVIFYDGDEPGGRGLRLIEPVAL
jgi:D-glycero-alpha-D-manno-heptose-7-phosphate kinase